MASFDTRSVPVRHRIDYWEEQCSENVVGLRCSSLEEDGFQARFRHLDFGGLKVIDITGMQHVIERTPDLLRAREKDSVFLALLLRGKAFVNRAGDCLLLNEGDSILYDTNSAYMHGFPSPMRHVIFDLPGAEFRARFPGWSLKEAIRYDGAIGTGRPVSAVLRRAIRRFLPSEGGRPDRAIVDELWTAMETAHDIARGGARNAYHSAGLMRARKAIAAHLADPDLSPDRIAAEIGIATRQLNRLFAPTGNTVGQTILAMRLDRARHDLANSAMATVSITEIALSWGFNSPAHFTRSFRDRFGQAPSDIRPKRG